MQEVAVKNLSEKNPVEIHWPMSDVRSRRSRQRVKGFTSGKPPLTLVGPGAGLTIGNAQVWALPDSTGYSLRRRIVDALTLSDFAIDFSSFTVAASRLLPSLGERQLGLRPNFTPAALARRRPAWSDE